jgi:Skp family chaperone for outer membrane proteins
MAEVKSSQTQQQNHSHYSPIVATILVSFALSIAAFFFLSHLFSPRIAYINTGKLMVGFSEANNIEKEIKAEDDKWQAQLKALQDSLQSQIDKMSKEYNTATPVKKKELQDMLSARNQQVNNFRQANIRKMEELRQKKMQTVFDKANVFMTEYGKKHRYSIILGTVAGGSILYGDERKYDITEGIIKGLNERYK